MILEIIEEDRYPSFTYANWYLITVNLLTAWILSSYRNICMNCEQHMMTRFHFPIQLRVDQGLALDERSRIEFFLYLVLSGQTLTTIISLSIFLSLLFLSLIHSVNSTFPLLSSLSIPLRSLHSPFFCPILYISLNSHPIRQSVCSPCRFDSTLCLLELLNRKLERVRRIEKAG